MNESLMPFIWVALTLPILLLMQRWIHTHLHGIALLLMGKPDRAVILYAIILFPGVVLHELSHWLTATLLGVRTGSFSLLPRRQADGSVQLGYVEYYKSSSLGAFRESLIGGAPLVTGTAVILLIGFRIFGVTNLSTAIQSGDVDTLVTALSQVFGVPDFLVWLYLLFAVSNAMMPSRSDRRAWPALILTLAIIAVVMVVLDIEAVIFAGVANWAPTVFGYLGSALSMAIAVDVLFMIVLSLIEGLLSRIKGVNVVYGNAEVPPGTSL
ncbi:MAG: hypothetical protein H6667_00485 [Ardenticatenaceae bacterium]|nr:hypothetical protein [Ardenticatenaceae bacterium]MCB9444854.1 hypothetical protein [Ardenticatenaceae bacterium]